MHEVLVIAICRVILKKYLQLHDQHVPAVSRKLTLEG